jgi:hypothetical protein
MVLALRRVLALRWVLSLRSIPRVRVLECSLAGALIDIDPVLAMLIPARNPRGWKRGSLALALVLVRDVLDEVHRDVSGECEVVLITVSGDRDWRSQVDPSEGNASLSYEVGSRRNYPALPDWSHPPVFRGR